MSRYGREIEADLAPGIDLAAEWRSRRWRRLLNLIDHLPPDSAFAEASAQDDEVAELLAESGSGEPIQPRIRDFGPTNQLLTRLIEVVQENTVATVAVAGGKPPRVDSLPRPETAMERLARRREQAAFDDLLDDIEAAQARWAARRSGPLSEPVDAVDHGEQEVDDHPHDDD